MSFHIKRRRKEWFISILENYRGQEVGITCVNPPTSEAQHFVYFFHVKKRNGINLMEEFTTFFPHFPCLTPNTVPGSLSIVVGLGLGKGFENHKNLMHAPSTPFPLQQHGCISGSVWLLMTCSLENLRSGKLQREQIFPWDFWTYQANLGSKTEICSNPSIQFQSTACCWLKTICPQISKHLHFNKIITSSCVWTRIVLQGGCSNTLIDFCGECVG